MLRRTSCGLIAILLLLPTVAGAQTLDQEITALAGKVSKALASQGFKSVATVDFTDLQGQVTELGRSLAEQLAVEIVSSGGVSMVDRANIKSILAEHKLNEEILGDAANAQKLGKFAGVDVILTGSITALDTTILLTVKAVATASARLVAAGKITFAKTSEIQQLLNRSVSGGTNLSLAAPSSSGSGTEGVPRYEDAIAIATKNYGPLRAVLRSVTPVTLSTDGRLQSGIRCSFDLINREVRDPIVVALNAENPHPYASAAKVLRSSVLDDRGGLWRLPATALGGIAFVSAGVHGRDGLERYNPSDIVKLLQLRDELGRDTDDPADGTTSQNGSYPHIDVHPYTPPGAPPPPANPFIAYRGNQFISGSMTTIEPGRSIRVTMDFELLTTGGGSTPKSIQIGSEIVVGVLNTGLRRSYSLQNVTFDRVIMPTQ